MRTLFLLLLFCITLFKATGQPGSLDSTFGNNGIQKTAFLSHLNSLDEEGRVVLTRANGDIFVAVKGEGTRIVKYLPDGTPDSSYGIAGTSTVAALGVTSAVMQENKILVAGDAVAPHTYASDFALARYKADGKLDFSFGKNGKIITDFNGYNDIANAIVLQGDKIILAGESDNPETYASDFVLVRYTKDGTLDSSFGVNGKVTTDFDGHRDNAKAMVLQGDNIVVCGGSSGDFALARYTANGVLDSSFGVNGLVTTDFNNSWEEANAIALKDGKIVVAGYNGDFLLARYAANGTLDSSFGVNGKVVTKFKNLYSAVTSMVLQEDKIVVAGSSDYYSEFALARYTSDGVLDSSFGENGQVATDFNSPYDNYANSIALQGNKLIVAGSTYHPAQSNHEDYNSDFTLVRYTSDGDVDSSFGNKGLLAGYFPVPASQAIFTDVAMQGSKIITAGYAKNDSLNTDFAVARYTASGVLDSSFGNNGKVTTDFNNSDDYATSLALQQSKIVVGGYTGAFPSSDFAILRYTADGKLDSSFGVNGKVVTDFNNANAIANAIALQGDKILLGGYINSDFALARYTANGVLDSSFGVNGLVTTDLNNSLNQATSIVLQGNKIILAGNVWGNANNYIGLARYTANGVLDSSFGVKGKVITEFNNAAGKATSIALQGDKIIVGGDIYDDNMNTGEDFVVVRYAKDGQLDSTFGVNGKVVTDFKKPSQKYSDDFATSMALHGDKIILAGYAGYYNDNFIPDFALARYTANGTPDSSFGVNGKVRTNFERVDRLQAIVINENRLYAAGGIGGYDFFEYLHSKLSDFGRVNSYGAIVAYQLEAPEPTISITDVEVSEAKKFAIATVRLSAPTNKVVRVHFATRDKTAVSNEDYMTVSGPLFFIPGVNTTAKIIIPVVDDSQHESNEQFEIVLSNVHNATVQDSVAIVTIIDNDEALITKQNTSLHINVSPNPSTDAFTVQLNGNNLKQPISIRIYDISGRLIEERNRMNIGQSLRLGEQYTTGTYIIKALQGSQSVQTKIVKISR